MKDSSRMTKDMASVVTCTQMEIAISASFSMENKKVKEDLNSLNKASSTKETGIKMMQMAGVFRNGMMESNTKESLKMTRDMDLEDGSIKFTLPMKGSIKMERKMAMVS